MASRPRKRARRENTRLSVAREQHAAARGLEPDVAALDRVERLPRAPRTIRASP